MPQPSLTSSASFQALQTHAIDAEDWQMRDLFAADPQRFERLSVEAAGLFLDYSKNRLDGRTLELLASLARERGVEQLRDAMFAGDKINLTENRAVLHTALRAPREQQITVDGQDVTADVHAVLDHVKVSASRCAAANGRAIPARKSPTSSTSASAAPTSARRWSAWRCASSPIRA
jgi:glucose-6-phosphate isomerase